MLGGKGKRGAAALQEGSASTTDREDGLPQGDARSPGSGGQREPVRRRHHRDRLVGQRKPAARQRTEGGAGHLLPQRIDHLRHAAARCRRRARRQGASSSASMPAPSWSRRWSRARSTAWSCRIQSTWATSRSARWCGHSRAKSVDRRIDTGVAAGRRASNMNEPAMKELLAPDLSASSWIERARRAARVRGIEKSLRAARALARRHA